LVKRTAQGEFDVCGSFVTAQPLTTVLDRTGTSMQLRFSEPEIARWAGEYSYSRNESDLLLLREAVQQQGHLTKDQLALLAQWKSPRSAGRVASNSEQYVQEITGFALHTQDERARIESLTLLDGVLWPTASVVLHLFHRDRYPILDYRAVWSVQATKPQYYTFPFWWQYVEFCRRVADRTRTDVRTLDRALWQFSKANQPKGAV